MALLNDWNYHPVNIFLRDDQGEVMGGILGGVWAGWLHLNFLWVHESLRNQQYGSQLLQQAEDQARSVGAHHSYLDTYSFQARPFYECHGYAVWGELADCPPGHTHYGMWKKL